MANIGAGVKNFPVVRPIEQVAASAFSVVGTAVDLQNYESFVWEVTTGALTGSPSAQTVDAKLQHSEDNSTWADVAAGPSNPAVAITQITAANSDRRVEIDRRPLRRYVRALFTVAFTDGSTPKIGLASHITAGDATIKPV